MVHLLGAQTILTGISARVAQTLVDIAISELTIRHAMGEGIALALRLRERGGRAR